MSARTQLLADLSALLTTDPFRISTRADSPEFIDVNTLNVRVFTDTITGGPMLGQLTTDISLWILSGSQDPAVVDDRLEAGLDIMLEALLALPYVSFRSAKRGVMDGSSGEPTWHGYLFNLTTFLTVTETD